MNDSDAAARWVGAGADYDLPHLRLRRVAAQIGRLDPATVVDLGCSRGTLGRLLSPAVKYVGVDFAEPPEGDFDFRRADLNDATALAGTVEALAATADVVACSGILEYVEDKRAVLMAARAMARSGGRLVLTYFNDAHVYRRTQRALGRSPYIHEDWRRLLSKPELLHLVATSGWAIEQVEAVSRGLRESPSVTRTTSARPPRWRHAGMLAHQVLVTARVAEPPHQARG